MKKFIEEITGGKKRGIPGSVYHRQLPGFAGEFREIPPWVSAEIRLRLEALEINKLFSHQVAALDLIRSGENVVVSTPTASGKSLIYNLAAAEAVLADPGSRALYLFPLKALEQDQVRALEETFGGILTANIYDGDTPQNQRLKIRKDLPRVLVTNPDMLHVGILPYHANWSEFWPGLKYVILDELHTYRGIFGSHVSQVLRRLRRVAEHYGAHPQFLFFSATIGNPGELAGALSGLPFQEVSESGAPRAGRHFLFYNPSTSPYTVAARIFARAVEKGFRTIAFTRARKITELIYQWVLDDYPEWKDKIAAYRAGYLPEERREIEKGLFTGRLKGVVATSALELGIDIGGLEVGVLVGYPGTIATTWQRSGRVGRQILAPEPEAKAIESESLVVLIATADALDQFFMNDPEEFFRRRPEAAIADPENPVVVKSHLVCAAAELPLGVAGDPMNPKSHREIIGELEKEGGLLRDDEGSRWVSSRRYPQRKIGLRSAGDEFAIRSVSGEVVGMIDEVRVKSECHPGAIYLHRGKQYRGEDIDWGKKEVLVRPVEADYYTVPSKEEEVEILREEADRNRGRVRFGRVRVTERVTGYEQKRFSGERTAEFPLDLPESVFETEALWFGIPGEARDGVEREKRDFAGTLHAVEHALIAIFPLFALCDRNDLGGVSYPYNLQVRGPAIFVYDGHPGGVGLCRKGFQEFPELVRATRDLIRRCPCQAGCPSCVQSPKCGSGNRPLDKPGALLLASELMRMMAEDIMQEGLSGYQEVRKGGSGDQNVRTRKSGDQDIRKPEKLNEPNRPDRLNRPDEPERPGRIIFFDLETQKSAAEVGGWERADAMRVSIAVVWDSLANAYLRFRESGMEELARVLKGADLVVGFNLEGFDYQVLSAYPEFADIEIKTLDILLELKKTVGMRISLKNLSRSTLGKDKAGDGLLALEWFRTGDFDRLFQYCEKDVELVRELFEFGLKYGYLLLERDGRPVRVPADWREELGRRGICYCRLTNDDCGKTEK